MQLQEHSYRSLSDTTYNGCYASWMTLLKIFWWIREHASPVFVLLDSKKSGEICRGSNIYIRKKLFKLGSFWGNIRNVIHVQFPSAFRQDKCLLERFHQMNYLRGHTRKTFMIGFIWPEMSSAKFQNIESPN